MPPTVSVVVPCYNAARWVAETMDSLLSSSGIVQEVIAVDDGSEDGTAACLERFVSRGVRVIRQTNKGASAARNRALAIATGDFIQFLDADDLLDPHKIAVQVEALRRTDGTKVASCGWGTFTTSAAEATCTPEQIWCNLSPVDFLVTYAERNVMFPISAWLIPRHLCETAGPWDEQLSINDDGEFTARVVAASTGIVFCEDVRAYYRVGNPLSLSSRHTAETAKSDLRAWNSIVSTMMRLEHSPRVTRAAATGYQRLQVRYTTEFPEVVLEAQRQEQRFGGGGMRFDGGLLFRAVLRVFGWRTALRLRRAKLHFVTQVRSRQ